MKNKKLLVVLGVIIVFTGIVSFEKASPDDEPESEDVVSRNWQQFPPLVDGIWVQKLAAPLSDSSNLIMSIKYKDDGITVLPSTIYVYNTSPDSIAFHDDGAGPDSVAGDHNYAAYLKEDLNVFTAQVEAGNARLDEGPLTVYEGHDARIIHDATYSLYFDTHKFNDGHKVLVDPHFPATLFNCQNNFKKDYSLFVTDLSVTECTARTYNVITTNGNPVDAWTFG